MTPGMQVCLNAVAYSAPRFPRRESRTAGNTPDPLLTACIPHLRPPSIGGRGPIVRTPGTRSRGQAKPPGTGNWLSPPPIRHGDGGGLPGPQGLTCGDAFYGAVQGSAEGGAVRSVKWSVNQPIGGE